MLAPESEPETSTAGWGVAEKAAIAESNMQKGAGTVQES
jgi:hypothetical protein